MTPGVKLLLGLAASTIATAAATRTARARHSYSFRDRSVIITGGSRGLGLVLARELVAEGAKVALLSRSRPELDRAREELERRGAHVVALVCDIRERDGVEAAVEDVIRQFGGVDVLINNAGTIVTGPVEHMTMRDFEDAMAVHFWGALYGALAVAPHMRKQGGGRIVNVSSIAGKIAVPHLVPYCASKFALTGLSDALRAELSKDGIVVTTVCPGLMRTGSHVNAMFKGPHPTEFTLFALQTATPLTSMDAGRAARQIVEACRRGDAELIITAQARVATLIAALFPEQVALAMKLIVRFLPGPSGPEGDEPKTGWESQSWLAPSALTWLPDRAARRNNQVGRSWPNRRPTS